jgi:large subunit ribosomal protein L3
MSIGIVGIKQGMTRVFLEDGRSVPVTVITAEPNRVTQVKRADVDGYNAIQVTFGAVKQSRVNKPAAGHFAKAAVEAGKALREFRLESETELEVGSEISVATFEAGAMVDVTSRSKGKGFQGVIKRYNFRTQDATHGNSLSHRAPGSIGQCQTPGRVWKGKKMAGHMGAEQVTTQSLEVVRVDEENNVLLIKGAVPGAKGQAVMVRPAIKARAKAEG